jgi:3-deoxy-manno-octulosonate cytidylyltransferase (CMP-KDO synthetase)
VLVAIPARLASTRLPSKPLLDLGGRPMIARVARNALGVEGARVVVVTDDARVAEASRTAGARAHVSRTPAASGSDRIRRFLDETGAPWPDVVVNLQGDEPLLEPDVLRALLARLREEPGAEVATPLRALRQGEEADPHVVKAALRPDGTIEDFARLPLEDLPPVTDEEELRCAQGRRWHAHVGVYAFRAAAFRAFTDLAPSPREERESLEQLRMLENGIPIHGVVVETSAVSVDTPEDAERVRRVLGEMQDGVRER